MNNSNFFFHESFAPQCIYISKILELASHKFSGSKREISQVTGIPTGDKAGKVVPHIKYSNYMDLIDYKLEQGIFHLELTELGKVVFYEDQYLMNDISKLLIHYNLTRSKYGAPQWYYVFREYPHQLNSNALTSDIEEKALHKYGKNPYLSVIKTMYSNEEFDSISPIEIKNQNSVYFKRNFPMYDCINLYAYSLLNDWEILYPTQNEITINDIINKLKWSSVFGFDYDDTLEVLDDLNALGVIKLNKQMDPITIVKCDSSIKVKRLIYNGLI